MEVFAKLVKGKNPIFAKSFILDVRLYSEYVSTSSFPETFHILLGADYMEISNPGWNFDSLNRVEISSQLNSKLLFQMTLQLHVKISTRYTELKFQLGLAKPRWNFNPRWKFQIFHIIIIFFNPGLKFDTTHTWIPCLYLKKYRRRPPKHVSNGLMINLSILCHEMFKIIWQFICKILILEYW